MHRTHTHASCLIANSVLASTLYSTGSSISWCLLRYLFIKRVKTIQTCFQYIMVVIRDLFSRSNEYCTVTALLKYGSIIYTRNRPSSPQDGPIPGTMVCVEMCKNDGDRTGSKQLWHYCYCCC